MQWLLKALDDQVFFGASPTVKIALVVSGIIMYLAWLGAYALTYLKCRRDRTYGIPHASICFNVSWELLFSFTLVAQFPYSLLIWGNRLWLLFDIALVSQLFLFGRERQTSPWIRRHFYPITVGTILLSGAAIYLFSWFAMDLYGVASSFIGNLTMSILFIGLVFKRPNLEGLSYKAAWLKMLGTAGGAVFCFLWWPLQFLPDRSLRPLPAEWGEIPDVGSIEPSYGFLYFLYLAIPLFDGIYIYLLAKRRKELGAAACDTG